MREYSQIGSSPDRWGTTMSAVVYELMKQPDTRERVLALVRGLVDAEVADLEFAEARVDALQPEDHDGVVICGRDAQVICGRDVQGRTALRRLVDPDRYVEVAGGGAIGTAITRGTLSRWRPAVNERSWSRPHPQAAGTPR
jgi:hypothetical protein